MRLEAAVARRMGRKKGKKGAMNLLEDSSSDSEGAEAGKEAEFKVNEAYARRFEHNKRREEQHRLQEKHPELAARLARGEANLSGDEEETSTSEDESGDDLISSRENEDMLRTLVKIKNKDPSIYDRDAEFYSRDESGGEEEERRERKPRSKGSKNANTLRSITARRAFEEGAEGLAHLIGVAEQSDGRVAVDVDLLL